MCLRVPNSGQILTRLLTAGPSIQNDMDQTRRCDRLDMFWTLIFSFRWMWGRTAGPGAKHRRKMDEAPGYAEMVSLGLV